MQVSMAQVKLGTVRTILRLMPLLLMGGLTLLTFWLVQKNTPLPANVIERPRLHEPDYTLKNGALSYLNEDGQTKYRILGKELIHYDFTGRHKAQVKLKRPAPTCWQSRVTFRS